MTSIDHLLCPEKILAIIIYWRPADPQLTTRAACAHERELGLCTILLREVGRFKERVSVFKRKFVQLELVHASGTGKGKEKEGGEDGEDHDGLR